MYKHCKLRQSNLYQKINDLVKFYFRDLGNNKISLIEEGTFSVFKKLKNL